MTETLLLVGVSYGLWKRCTSSEAQDAARLAPADDQRNDKSKNGIVPVVWGYLKPPLNMRLGMSIAYKAQIVGVTLHYSLSLIYERNVM